jgi:hypothetical protein
MAASIVVLSDMESLQIDSLGRFHTRRELLCKALDQRGADSLQRRVIHVDTDADTVIIESARIRLFDGTWRNAEVNGFDTPVVPEAPKAPAYSRYSQQTVLFPKLQPGMMAHLVYRIEPKPGAKPSRKGGTVLFGDYVHIMDKQFVIKCPIGTIVHFAMQNSDAFPTISEENGIRTYAWTFHDCMQVDPEPQEVGLANLVPRLLWTLFPDWEALGIWTGDIFWGKVDSSLAAVDGFFLITSPELRGTPALMNATLWNLLNVHAVELPLDITGFTLHSADWVWRTRYATPVDKAVLLTAILRAYGYNPVPVFVPMENVPFCQLPVLEQFRHVILAVPSGEDTLWLDPAAESYAPGDLPHACSYGMGCALVAGTPLIMKVPQTGDSLATRTEIRASLDPSGGLSGFAEGSPHGDAAAHVRQAFLNAGNQARNEYAQRTVRRFGSEARVTEFYMSNVADMVTPLTTRVNFDCPGASHVDSGRLILQIPDSPFDFADCSLDTTVARRYPAEFPVHGRFITECGITVPQDYKLISWPPPLIIQNPYVYIELSIRILPQGLEWTKSVHVKADQIPVADYPAVRAAFEAVEAEKNRQIMVAPVLAKAKPKPAGKLHKRH